MYLLVVTGIMARSRWLVTSVSVVPLINTAATKEFCCPYNNSGDDWITLLPRVVYVTLLESQRVNDILCDVTFLISPGQNQTCCV